MNRAGFTTLEVIIASALIVALITAGGAGVRQMNLLSQVATTRTAHTEMRTQVLEAISISGNCASSLGNPQVNFAAMTPFTSTPIPKIMYGLATVLDSTAPMNTDGMTYAAALRFPTPGNSDVYAFGLGRPATQRYDARLEIRGIRKRALTTAYGMQTDIVSTIPLSAEFDVNGKMVSCTIHSGDVDDMLAGSNHTVRECLQYDGYPIQTAYGLICRIPVPYQPQTASGYAGTIPTCASLTSNAWNDVPVGPPNYNTTMPIDISGQDCHGSVTAATGWHTMSRSGVEQAKIRVKKGTSKALTYLLGGGAFTGIVVVAFIPAIGTIIAAAAALIGFIVSLFHKCQTEDVYFYSEVTGVGCI